MAGYVSLVFLSDEDLLFSFCYDVLCLKQGGRIGRNETGDVYIAGTLGAPLWVTQ